MRSFKIALVVLVVAVGMFSCKEPFTPPINSASQTFLVVEGILNPGPGATAIRLTRSYQLSDTARLRTVRNAVVTVEGKDNSSRNLLMTGDGLYTSANLNLTIGNEYRLRIKVDNKEYLSAYVVARKTPEIDEIGYNQDEEGVKINVSTHDLASNTRYYKWDYDETWEIRSYYISDWIYRNGNVVARTPAENVYNCWKYASSSRVLIGSTARLQDNVLSKAPLLAIENGAERFSVRYSILVRQVSIDKQAYEFYDMMRRTTETLGSIFDVQPTELKGNISCISNPGELVIGYVSVGTVTEKRIFIDNRDLRDWRFSQVCESFEVPNKRDSLSAYYGGGAYMPYSATYFGLTIVSYSSSSSICVDCTTRGGNTTKPTYW